jgi:hypothetical protein
VAKEVTNYLGQRQNNSKTLETFTLFSKLPLELQDEIWKLAALSKPRKVQLRSHYKFYMRSNQQKCGYFENNTPVVLRQISQRTRDVCLELGYIELEVDHPYFENPKFIFHPELDVLIIPDKALKPFPRALEKNLQDASALDKVKFLAIDISDSSFDEALPSLRKFRNIEVLFLILDTSRRAGPYQRDQEYFEFEAIPQDQHDAHLFDFDKRFRRLGRNQQSIRQNLQKKLVRGPERIAPHIHFVKCTKEPPRKYDRRDYGW